MGAGKCRNQLDDSGKALMAAVIGIAWRASWREYNVVSPCIITAIVHFVQCLTVSNFTYILLFDSTNSVTRLLLWYLFSNRICMYRKRILYQYLSVQKQRVRKNPILCIAHSEANPDPL